MQNDLNITQQIGVVVIGRNEGDRLIRCLNSLNGSVDAIVYVDSGSTDNSEKEASRLGVDVLPLDLSIPFTAARARNEGFARLIALSPDIKYVQFVDGDCEVVPGWIQHAADFLIKHPAVAVVCGRRRERYPDSSIYNLMCDIEWNTPVGEAKACGGDALMRTDAFQVVSGFRSQLIAGEEPELCLRLRGQGWQIWRLDAEMTLHDAALTKFRQWWRRTMRGGYAFAEGAHLHGNTPERHWVKESRRALIWGGILPLFALFWLLISWKIGLAVLLAYPLQVFRLGLQNIRNNHAQPFTLAFYLVLGKFPELLGQLKFQLLRLAGNQSKLIEYK